MAASNRRRLLFVLLAGAVVTVVEFVAGYVAGSLVLMADAAHYATDVAAVGLAFAAVSWALRPASALRTFGHHRAEVVAAFVNALALWAVSAYLIWESIQRLRDPPSVEGPIVAVVGGVTLVVNLILAWVLHRGAGHSLNVKAAYIHILSDVLGSAAALVAGLLIHYRGLAVADPLVTLVVTALLAVLAWKLTRETFHILMQGTPEGIDAASVAAALRDVRGVSGLHDLHIWTLSTGVASLTVHLVIGPASSPAETTAAAQALLASRFGLQHVTIQVDGPDSACSGASCDWPTAPAGT